MPPKLHFLRRILRHRLNRQPRICHYCGSASAVRRIKRKKLVLDILKCETCKLVFRWPFDTLEESVAYYQNEYGSDYPQVDLPDQNELREWMERNFADTPLDFAPKIKILQAIRGTGRVLDYGCSWGYGTYQLAQRGFQAMGFEISRPRARYARTNLGVRVIDDFEELRALSENSFDIVFSNHVLEHLANLKETLDVTAHLLVPGGLAFHVLPNFTGKTAQNWGWLQWIGEEHPLAPTMEFFAQNLPKHGFRELHFGSSPFDESLIAAILCNQPDGISTDGDELLLVAMKQL